MKRYIIIAVWMMGMFLTPFSTQASEKEAAQEIQESGTDAPAHSQSVWPSMGEMALPELAREAITKSQGILALEVEKVGGIKETISKTAVLLYGDGFILRSLAAPSDSSTVVLTKVEASREGWGEGGLLFTSLDALPSELAILRDSKTTFRHAMVGKEIPAKFYLAWKYGGLAIWRVPELPVGMQATHISETFVPAGKEVFAYVKGILPLRDGTWAAFDRPYRGRVVDRISPIAFSAANMEGTYTGGEFLQLDQSPHVSFSGSLAVNEYGEGVGIVRVAQDGSSEIIGAGTLYKALDMARQYEKKLEEGTGLSFSERRILQEYQETFGAIIRLHARFGRERPANIVDACAREMLKLKHSGACRDRFSIWNDPEELAFSKEDMKGSFGGIGVEVSMRENQLTVMRLIRNTPAERAGIQVGDRILAIDEKRVTTLNEAVGVLRGFVGTSITLSIERVTHKDPVVFVLVREHIIMKSVSVDVIEGPKPIGVIRIHNFTLKTADEIYDAIEALKAVEIEHIALDLRNNSGGLLVPALEILSLFARPEDILVTLRFRSREEVINRATLEQMFSANGEDLKGARLGVFQGIAMAVLINKNSASASEVVAGALKDWGIPIIGVRSFGKGVGQRCVPMYASAYCITEFEFLVGNSRTPIQDTGVIPTIEVAQPEGSTDDIQLKRAIESLSHDNDKVN